MAEGNQPQKSNLAAEAFMRHYAALHDALALPDVASRLATKLYGGAIITPETRDAVQTTGITPAHQASRLLQAVEASIKIDYRRLRKFTRLLKKQPVLLPIAKKLRQCYRDLVSEARLTESSSSGSDTDSTEQHQPQGPEQLLPSPTSTSSPLAQEQNPSSIPLHELPQEPYSTEHICPHPTSQPIPIPDRHRKRTGVSLSSPESYPTSDEDLQMLFDSQEGTMGCYSSRSRSSLPAEERARRRHSVSPQPHSRQEEHSSKSKPGIKFTNISPYEEWCCHLKNDDGITASGVIVKLNYTPEELNIHLPGLRPIITYPKKYGSVQKCYMLITCHHVIPGMSYLNGWNLEVGLGKSRLKSPVKLQGLVCGAVSCCGEDGFISSGPLKPAEETTVFSPHLNDRCWLDLDFTILFLNPAKLLLNRKGAHIEPPEINLNLTAEKHVQLQLYQRERHKIVPIPLRVQPQDSVRVQPQDSVRVQPQDSSPSTLKDEIKVYKTLQVIHYKQSEGQLTQCCAGSPLVSCDPDSDTTLVGIHTKAGSNVRGSGTTLYGIFQLLKGQPAAFFAVMEQPHARKKWPFRWSHLLIHALESDAVGEKEKPLSYLLEILHLLLTDMNGISLIEFRVSDTSFKLKSALELLSALFKQFDKYGCEEIAEAIPGTFTDELTVNEFSKEIQQLSKFFVDLLNYLRCADIKYEVDLVKAYFKCYNWVLNFEYKGKFQPVLSTHDVTEKLQTLRKDCSEQFPLDTNYAIGRNFHDIWLQLMKCKHESQIHQLEAQNQQFKAQLQQLTEQNEQLTEQNEQLTEQKEQLTEQNEQLTEQNEQLTAQNEQLTEQKEQLTAQNEQLTEQKEQLTAQNQQLIAQDQQLTEQNEQLTEQNEQLTEQKEQLTAQNEQLTEQKEQLTAQNQQLIAQDQQLTEQNEQLTEQNEQLTEQNEQILAQDQQLTAQNEQLTTQNNELTAQNQMQLDKCATCMQKLQQTERMLREQEIEYELKIQKLEEQLQMQQDEMMKTYMYRRQSS